MTFSSNSHNIRIVPMCMPIFKTPVCNLVSIICMVICMTDKKKLMCLRNKKLQNHCQYCSYVLRIMILPKVVDDKSDKWLPLSEPFIWKVFSCCNMMNFNLQNKNHLSKSLIWNSLQLLTQKLWDAQIILWILIIIAIWFQVCEVCLTFKIKHFNLHTIRKQKSHIG